MFRLCNGIALTCNVEKRRGKNGKNTYFPSNDFNPYFYNKFINSLTKLGVNDDLDREDSDSDDDNEVNNWANADFSSFTEFNLVWYTRAMSSLHFGMTPVKHKRTLPNVDAVEIRIVELSDDRLAEIANLPLEVDKGQKGVKWTNYLYSKKNGFFWFFNRHDGTIKKTSTSCRLRGGFLTRNQAAMNGIKVSTITEMNNVGKCFEHKDWPRESISGEKGGCAPIAAYYICFDLSVNVIELLKTEFHEELSLSDSSSIYVTDGSYNIVDVMNSRMSTTFLRQIYPSADVTSLQVFHNAIFGDRENCGKFLIELPA